MRERLTTKDNDKWVADLVSTRGNWTEMEIWGQKEFSFD